MWAGVSLVTPSVSRFTSAWKTCSPGLDLRVSATSQFSGGGIGFNYSTFGVMLEGDVLYGLDLGADPAERLRGWRPRPRLPQRFWYGLLLHSLLWASTASWHSTLHLQLTALLGESTSTSGGGRSHFSDFHRLSRLIKRSCLTSSGILPF